MEKSTRETNARVFKDAEVEHHGLIRNGAGGQTFWTWGPDELPEIPDGKQVVFLYPCNCGCWGKDLTEAAAELISKHAQADRFVLRDVDPRYIVRSDENFWYIIVRPSAG